MYFWNFNHIIKLCTLLLLCLSACFQNSDENITPTQTEIKKSPPVKLEVSQAFSVQNSLFLKASIEALTKLSSHDVEVTAIGLNEGKVISQQKTRMSEIIRKGHFEKGKKYLVPFELPVNKISEFQLKCSWGDDVKKNIDNAAKEQKTDDLEPPDPYKPGLNPSLSIESESGIIERKIFQSKLSIDNIELIEESCENVSCQLSSTVSPAKAKKVTIKAQVKNLSDKPVKDLILAFGLFWSPEGKVTELPKDKSEKRPGEQELEFKDLVLPPGGSVPFNVKLDRALIELPGGAFRPHVRVLSFN